MPRDESARLSSGPKQCSGWSTCIRLTNLPHVRPSWLAGPPLWDRFCLPAPPRNEPSAKRGQLFQSPSISSNPPCSVWPLTHSERRGRQRRPQVLVNRESIDLGVNLDFFGSQSLLISVPGWVDANGISGRVSNGSPRKRIPWDSWSPDLRTPSHFKSKIRGGSQKK